MAKVVCTVTYHRRAKNAKDKVTRTYEIQFEKQDTFEIQTATKNLVLKVEHADAAAKKLIKRWKHTRINTPAGELSDECFLDPVKAKRFKQKTTKFPASFAVPTAAVGKFQCGFYETNPKTHKKEFEQYPGGVGLPFPPVP